MLEPPDLSLETIASALRASFGIHAAALVFLPIGNDPASWAYRVEVAQGPSYFLKLRAGASRVPGATVPSYLRRHGVPHVLAPLPTRKGEPFVQAQDFALLLFPMIEASTGAEAGLSPDHWRMLGAAVKQLHTVAPTPDLARIVGRESFRPSRREVIADLEPLLAAAARQDPVTRELAGLWRARQGAIHALIDRADAMGRRLARLSLPLALCHADLHTWNVLLDSERQLWIVDWDEAILAPKERDLMFVVGGIGHDLVNPRDTECFFAGYGETAIDQRLLAYYRCAWAVQDIAAYGEQAALTPGLGEETRRAAVDGLRELFEPGNIVDLANELSP